MSQTTLNYFPIGQSGSLQSYMQMAYQTPVLSREEELELFGRLQQDGDLEAARKLVLANLRYVVYIARSYTGYGLPLEDLIQEGSIGLMKSVKRFDTSHGVRLVSFAVHWIKAEIHDFILKNWRIVKVATTKAQRKLFFNLRKSKQRLGWSSTDEVLIIARDLGVKPEEVVEMESRLAGMDESFEIPEGESERETLAPAQRLIYDNDLNPEELVTFEALHDQQRKGLIEGLEKLDQRSLDIISSRFLTDEKVGLKELSQRYQVSMERIRQIEASALQKLLPFVEAT